MPIETFCPHCRKKYRVKDELAGKTIQCPNKECEKKFRIEASAPVQQASVVAAKSVQQKAVPQAKAASTGTGEQSKTAPVPEKKATSPEGAKAVAPKKKEAVPKKPTVTEADAEAIAAALFSDAPEPAAGTPEDTRTLDMSCAACDHKWTEPYAKQGKYSLCPECRHRQKIPEVKKQKAIDWRDPTANRPTLARGEELPEDLAAQQTRTVRIDSLEQAGAIEAPEVEPRPIKQRVMFGMFTAGILFTMLFFGVSYFRGRAETREQQYMPNALKELPQLADAELPKEQGPPTRALLHIAAGKFAARTGTKESRNDALKHFNMARNELEAPSKLLERDLILGELASAILLLGGTDEQVLSETHVRWLPAQALGNRPRINGDITTIQAELRRTLSLLRSQRDGADFEVRAAIIRRVALELMKKGQYEMLEEIISQGFTESELPEVRAQIALEFRRANIAPEKVREIAEQLKTTLIKSAATAFPTPISAQVLWQVVEPPMTGTPILVGPPGGGETTINARLAYSLLAACKENPSGAVDIAVRPGTTADRIRAFAYCAEFTKDREPILTAAVDFLGKDTRPEARRPAEYWLLRLAQTAAENKDTDKALAFANAIPSASLKAWAKGEIWRSNPNTANKPIETAALEKPESDEQFAIGHAWCGMIFAHMNALQSGETAPAKEYAQWPKGMKPFGSAGLALGLQDRNLK